MRRSRGRNYDSRRKKGCFSRFFTFVIFLAVAIAAVMVFFKISNIEVTGNSRYSADEITRVAGFSEGDNLFFINKFASIRRIFDEFPYIGEIQINRGLPNTVRINVSEIEPVASIYYENSYWLIDEKCKLLESVGSTYAEKYTKITGIIPIDPKVNSLLSVATEEEDKKKHLVSLMNALNDRGMMADVSVITAEKSFDMRFMYLGRFAVKLGRPENIPVKLSSLLSAVEKLESYEKGELDISVEKVVRLIPGNPEELISPP